MVHPKSLTMKNYYHLLFALVVVANSQLPTANLYSQVPQGVNYQAVVRNNTGAIIPNQLVAFRLSVRDGSSIGTVVYSERDTATTNQFGLATAVIGGGSV